MEPSIVLALMVAVLTGMGVRKYISEKTRRKNWAQLAQSLRLKYDEGIITGYVDGVQISVAVESRGSGKSVHFVTIFEAHIAGDLPAALVITPEGVLAKTVKLFAGEDVQIGLPDLDSKLMIRAQDDSAVHEWIQRSQVAEGLRQLVKLRGFQIKSGKVRLETRGAMSDLDQVRERLLHLVSITELISSGSAMFMEGSADDLGS